MMHRTIMTSVGYRETGEEQVLSLPYRSIGKSSLSMVVVLPKERMGLDRIASNLNIEKLEAWLTLEPETEVSEDGVVVPVVTHVELSLPRFELISDVDMTGHLARLGLDAIFDSQRADLSGIDGLKPSWIDRLLQKTWIKVDERGTEVAVTTSGFRSGAPRTTVREVVFKVDHPFLFMIREETTGTILFIGVVTRPGR